MKERKHISPILSLSGYRYPLGNCTVKPCRDALTIEGYTTHTRMRTDFTAFKFLKRWPTTPLGVPLCAGGFGAI